MTKNKAKKKIRTLKGFRDFIPEEAIKREWLREKMIEVFIQWGYDPIETPTLEPLELFEGEIGEDEKLFFKFEDLGGRKVAMRYDQTVPTVRFVGENLNDIALPFRRYQIQTVFRAEKPQRGRYREFIQADIDIFGIKSADADAEAIALSLDLYLKLGFENVLVLINSRELMKGIPYKAIVAIDKLKKIGEKGVMKEMKGKGISASDAKSYLKKVKNIKPDKTVESIFNYLKRMGFDEKNYKFEPTLARSFSYSEGPIWEVTVPEYKSGSVGGGERYDGMVKEITGKDIPATGIAFGFDRTLEALDHLKLIPKLKTKTKVLITIFSEETIESSIKVAKLLRSANISAELYPDFSAKLQKQLKYADKKGIPYAIIIGPDEILKDMVVFKDMKNKRQDTVATNTIIPRIQ